MEKFVDVIVVAWTAITLKSITKMASLSRPENKSFSEILGLSIPKSLPNKPKTNAPMRMACRLLMQLLLIAMAANASVQIAKRTIVSATNLESPAEINANAFSVRTEGPVITITQLNKTAVQFLP